MLHKGKGDYMEYKRFENTIVARLDKGDEIVSSLEKLCVNENIQLGMVSGLGAVNDVTIGIFNTEEKTYYGRECKGDYEIASLTGNITQMNEKPYLHLHITIGNTKTNEIYGGHLTKALISATGEIFITIIPGKVGREFSKEIGLNLMK